MATNYSSSASSSSAMGNIQWLEPQLLPKHKIFLSHSGAQKDFVEQLCVDLENYGYFPFFDKRRDSLGPGEDFHELIFKACRQCRIAVLILSEEFFTRSKWPMRELAAFVEAKKSRTELRILPVCLNFSLSSLKDDSKSKVWLQKWQQWEEKDTCVEWQAAVRTVDHIGALLSEKFDGHVNFRKQVVQSIVKLIPPESTSDMSHVFGSERLCEEILKHFKSSTLDHGTMVIRVGVYGIGGAGKSTLCKCLRDHLFADFLGRVCHVEFGLETLVNLQQKLLRELTGADANFLCIHVTSKEQGLHSAIKERMHRQRVFLALDNVSDSSESKEAAQILLREVQYHPDSIILVTARSEQVLLELGIHPSRCVATPRLREDEAKEIVQRQVNLKRFFGAPSSDPSAEWKKIERIVERCRDLSFHPLTLQVLGAQCFEDIEPDLHYSTSREHPLFSAIERSYSFSLADEVKDIFLDVALYTPEDFRTVGKICEWLSDTIYDFRSIQHLKRSLTDLSGNALINYWSNDDEHIHIHELHREMATRQERMGFAEGKFPRLELHPSFCCLKLLSLRNCEKLEVVVLQGLKCLQSLELSMCTALKTVNLREACSLAWLSVSLCNRLEGLDVPDSKSLKFVRVSNCNQLTALDLACCELLRAMSLAYSDSVKEVNLSGCKNLRALTLRFCKRLGLVNLRGVSGVCSFIKEVCPDLFNVKGSPSELFSGDVVRVVIDKWQNVPANAIRIMETSASLEELELLDCPMSRLPDLSGCGKLRKLRLHSVDILLTAAASEFYAGLLSSEGSCELPSSLESIHVEGCKNMVMKEVCLNVRGLSALRELVLIRVRVAWDWELRHS